jgi:hypothetical protein
LEAWRPVPRRGGGHGRYRKNGIVFRTSTVAPRYPLLVDTSLNQTGATLDNVVLSAPEVTTY